MLDSKRLAILAVLAALGAAGCGGDSDDANDSRGTGGTAAPSESAEELPTGSGSSADPDCQSKKDPETGLYQKTPEKCHLEVGQ